MGQNNQTKSFVPQSNQVADPLGITKDSRILSYQINSEACKNYWDMNKSSNQVTVPGYIGAMAKTVIIPVWI